MVGATDPGLLSRVAAELGEEEGITVRTVSGAPGRPSVLAVSMPPERADRLRAQYLERIAIEPDESLQHY
ncbi:hypothetical protein [Streptomyces sp. AF1A]|jgi:hypothetical protein|uniref:hypothetical protein n=1 Tax=Streptomyces sp. AF1A TaxID=3394350 RepID=UPI0039BCBFA8